MVEAHFTSRHAVEEYINYAIQKGVSRAQIFEQVGVHIDEASDYVSAKQLSQILQAIIELTGDHYIGMRHATQVQANSYDILGYLAVNCENLKQTMELVIQYESLAGTLGYTQILPQGKNWLISWQCVLTDPQIKRHTLESVITSWTVYTQELVRLNEVALQVWFEHKAPEQSALAEYEAIFRCPVLFEQADTGILVSQEQFTKPFPQANAALRTTLEQHAAANLARLQAQHKPLSFTERVIRLVRSGVKAGIPTSKKVIANKLNISERSLHRHLEKEESRFIDILDDIRLEVALSLLQLNTKTTQQIAEHLGFDEVRSFYRAFKIWTGLTTGEYLKKLSASYKNYKAED